MQQRQVDIEKEIKLLQESEEERVKFEETCKSMKLREFYIERTERTERTKSNILQDCFLLR
jgi:hypothetical protein